MCTKSKAPTINCSKVIAWTDTQIDRQTDTDSTEIIIYPHTRMVEIGLLPNDLRLNDITEVSLPVYF